MYAHPLPECFIQLNKKVFRTLTTKSSYIITVNHQRENFIRRKVLRRNLMYLKNKQNKNKKGAGEVNNRFVKKKKKVEKKSKNQFECSLSVIDCSRDDFLAVRNNLRKFGNNRNQEFCTKKEFLFTTLLWLFP